MLATFVAVALAASHLVASSALPLHARQNNNSNTDLGSLEQEYTAFLEQYNAKQYAVNVFNETFYETPSNFSKSMKGGEVLKLDRISGNDLNKQYGYPAGLTLWRLMYTSRDVFNQTVPATAFVLAPYAESKGAVAWTHGTSGITRDCAPSVQRTLYYDFDGLFQLVLQGYIVVATDYAGQGSDTQFNYIAGVSHADDASFSIVAARKALPKLDLTKWAVVGHSEGGMSAWATAEREAHSPIGGYLGGVSLAPSMDPTEINRRAFLTESSRQALTDSGSVFYPVLFAETIRRVFPTLVLSDYLTDTGLQLLKLNLQGGCYAAAATFFPNFSLKQVWKRNDLWTSEQALAWQAITKDQGKGKLDKPLLVIQGTADEAVSPAVNEDTFDAHCKQFNNKSPIEYIKYPGFRHGPVILASIQKWTPFLASLFANEKPSGFEYCKKTTIQPKISNASTMENYAVAYAGR